MRKKDEFRPGLTWCATSNALVALSLRNGKWMEEHRVKTFFNRVRSIAEDKKGNLWLGMLNGGILKVDFSTGIRDPVVKWRSHKLTRERHMLETIVRQRTREIDDKNRQLENQTLQLKDQSEKLKELDRIKSRFFANISHEFRTPLTLSM